ncbi:MAG: hypothetical protein IPM63_08040 [Acidobacteriota bacterium]|nr:MAG: hypothetical protein IPM63_08040 [Acidobacteriota bacterium]
MKGMKGVGKAKKLIVPLAVLFVVYLGSYAVLRYMNSEVWEKDGMTYVIFPENLRALYYLYRPVSYVDGALTGMRFHIGPHR